MFTLIAILLVLVPAVVILYPFVRGEEADEPEEDEDSPRAELARRRDAAMAGLRSAELDRAIDILTEEDYQWLREKYMTEAALALKAIELEEQQEQALLAGIEHEVRQVHLGESGDDRAEQPARCPECSAPLPGAAAYCPACGHPIDPSSSRVSASDSVSTQPEARE